MILASHGRRLDRLLDNVGFLIARADQGNILDFWNDFTQHRFQFNLPKEVH